MEAYIGFINIRVYIDCQIKINYKVENIQSEIYKGNSIGELTEI